MSLCKPSKIPCKLIQRGFFCLSCCYNQSNREGIMFSMRAPRLAKVLYNRPTCHIPECNPSFSVFCQDVSLIQQGNESSKGWKALDLCMCLTNVLRLNLKACTKETLPAQALSALKFCPRCRRSSARLSINNCRPSSLSTTSCWMPPPNSSNVTLDYADRAAQSQKCRPHYL